MLARLTSTHSFLEKTIAIHCNIKDPVTLVDYSRDPRNIAKKAEVYLKSSGIGDTAFFGPEAEFLFLIMFSLTQVLTLPFMKLIQ